MFKYLMCTYAGQICIFNTKYEVSMSQTVAMRGAQAMTTTMRTPMIIQCYIVGLGPNCKFIDLLFKCLVITFIKISFLNCFIVSEIIYSQTDTLTEELMYLR